jgi:hypothetical protein
MILLLLHDVCTLYNCTVKGHTQTTYNRNVRYKKTRIYFREQSGTIQKSAGFKGTISTFITSFLFQPFLIIISKLNILRDSAL